MNKFTLFAFAFVCFVCSTTSQPPYAVVFSYSDTSCSAKSLLNIIFVQIPQPLSCSSYTSIKDKCEKRGTSMSYSGECWTTEDINTMINKGWSYTGELVYSDSGCKTLAGGYLWSTTNCFNIGASSQRMQCNSTYSTTSICSADCSEPCSSASFALGSCYKSSNENAMLVCDTGTKGNSPGRIAGIVIGVILSLVVVVGVFVFVYWYRKRRQTMML